MAEDRTTRTDSAPEESAKQPSTERRSAWPGARPILFAFGWLCVVLGMIGVFVPGMPTTIFLILALWAFARSSERFHTWLYQHPRFGPSLQAWSTHRIVPLRAKVLAVSVMATSWLIFWLFIAESWISPTILGVILLAVALYIVTRPDKAPASGFNPPASS